MFLQQNNITLNLARVDYFEVIGNDICFHLTNGKIKEFVFDSRTEAEIMSKKITNAIAINKSIFRCE